MNTFPGREMPFFPCTWYSIDEDKGWVICEFRNRMKDPGDGSVHESPNLSVLKYAGDGLWSYEEDAYNPMNFLVMVQEYIQRCHKLGTISDEARVFAKNMNWELALALVDHEVVRIGLAGPPPIVDQPPWTEDVHLAEGVLVKGMLDRRLRPHHLAHFGLTVLVPICGPLLARFDGPTATGDEQIQNLCDVAHLAF